MACLLSLFLCPSLLAFGSVSADTGQRITAEAGQDSVTLPCSAAKETEIGAVDWSRPDLDPDYVLLFRDGQIDSEGQHPSFRNRVDLQDRQMKDGDMSLVLKGVTMDDTGTYLCIVGQGEDRRLISSIYLDVVSGGKLSCDEELRKQMDLLSVLAAVVVILVSFVYIYWSWGKCWQQKKFEGEVRELKNKLRAAEQRLMETPRLDLQLRDAKMELQRVKAELEEQTGQLIQDLKDAEMEIRSTKRELQAVKAELEEQTKGVNLQLKDAKMEAERHKKELQMQKTELETTKKELQRVKAELEEKNQPSQELEDAEMKAE